jgi:ElaB/YqjD/DUF883 family membrane-anchored ribosome-binding protein
MADTYKSLADDAARGASAVADDAADMASDFTNRAGDMASELQDQARAFGDRAVGYFRDHDMKAIANDLNSWVRSNPAQALIGAAALGFAAAALLRRR